MDRSDLGDRMKGYEGVSRHYLMKRTPIIRLDGKAFHTFKSVGINKYRGFNGDVNGSYEVIGNIHENSEFIIS
jgi:hypothetical protein